MTLFKSEHFYEPLEALVFFDLDEFLDYFIV